MFDLIFNKRIYIFGRYKVCLIQLNLKLAVSFSATAQAPPSNTLNATDKQTEIDRYYG